MIGPGTNRSFVEALREEGLCGAPPLTIRQADEVRAHLVGKPVRDAHVWAKGERESTLSFAHGAVRPPWPMMCHRMEDVVAAPHFFEAALGALLVALDYFDEPAVMYSMNAFWTQPLPGEPEYADTHAWHRDGDDRKQLVLFMYGTEVLCREDGAHLYQRGTHNLSDNALGRDFRAPREREIARVHGFAGRTFMADTGGLHMGLRPQTKPRLLLWARFGVTEPPNSYIWDKLEPAPKSLLGSRYPNDHELQKAIRLVVK